MTASRIYAIVDKSTKKPRLVRSGHPSTALRHVAAEAFDVRVATQDDIVSGLAAGLKVEAIAGEQTQLPTT
jgi:hypothetical protein